MSTLHNLQPGDHVRDRDGHEYEVREVYNIGNPAQQVLLSGEFYPQLISEMEKLGYRMI